MFINEERNLMRTLDTLSEILKGKEETKHVIEQYEYNKKITPNKAAKTILFKNSMNINSKFK